MRRIGAIELGEEGCGPGVPGGAQAQSLRPRRRRQPRSCSISLGGARRARRSRRARSKVDARTVPGAQRFQSLRSARLGSARRQSRVPREAWLRLPLSPPSLPRGPEALAWQPT